MNQRTGISSKSGRALVWAGWMIAVSLAGHEVAQGQGSLPEPPMGFTWESQGVLVYSQEGSFTTDLGQNAVSGVAKQLVLDETISLTTFDATPGLNQHILVHSSSYSVNLNGLGSVVVINLDVAQHAFSGTIGFNGWQLGGMATDEPSSNTLTNPGMVLASSSAALFGNGNSTSLSVILADSGAVPTTGELVSFDFDGTYSINLGGGTAAAQFFGSGSAYGNASLSTVYETFQLVEMIPEPSVVMMCVAGSVVLLRRRRS